MIALIKRLNRPQVRLTFATVAFPIIIYFYYTATYRDNFISAKNGWLLLFGIIYLIVIIRSQEMAPSRAIWITQIVFLMGLGLIINFMAEPGFLWIILLPLVGMAEPTLNNFGRWAIYGGTMLGASGPFILENGWDGIFTAALFIPAILFVIVFTRLTESANESKEQAEALTRDLEEANRKLGEYAVQAEELATTQERNRIAREIHDNLGHYLTVVNVQLEAAKTVMDIKPEKAKDAINKAQNLAQEGLLAVRQSVSSLREDPLSNRPLPDAIKKLIDENRASGITTELTIKQTPRPLSPNTSLTLYRVVQEGLTNIRKHAQASKVDVIVDYSAADQIQLAVRDNGKGSEQTGSGFGLLGIRERIHILGGRMEVESQPDQGFNLTVSVPG